MALRSRGHEAGVVTNPFRFRRPLTEATALPQAEAQELSVEEIKVKILDFLERSKGNFAVDGLAFILFGPVNGNPEEYQPSDKYYQAIYELQRLGKISNSNGGDLIKPSSPERSWARSTVEHNAGRYRRHRGKAGS